VRFLRPEDGDIGRLAFPALGALVIEPVFLMSDSAIVGHLGTAQLAGLAVGSVIVLNLVNLCLFLTFTTTASVARMVGAGAPASAARQAVDGLWLAAGIGVTLAGLLACLSDPLTSFFGGGAAALGYGRTYIDISLAGIPQMLVVLAATGVLRGFGDIWTPLRVAVAGGLLNIALNLALVYGLRMGIAGSATGTAVTQTLTAVWIVWLVVRRLRPSGINWLPTRAGAQVVGAGSFTLFVRTLSPGVALIGMTYVASHQGQVALAGHQACLTISGFCDIPAGALGIAAQVIVGRTLGAREPDKARSIVIRCMCWGLGAGIILGLGLAFARPLFGPVFSHDPAVRHQLVAVLLALALLQPVGGVLFVLDGVLIGAGDGRYLAQAGVVTLLVFAPVLALVLALHGTLVELWLGLGLYLAARLIALLLRLRTDAWLILGAGPAGLAIQEMRSLSR
jgi:putative MATE family efflux protein